MRIKVKKNGQSHGYIKLVLYKDDLFGHKDCWVASTKTSRVYRHLDGKPEDEVKEYLTNQGYICTLVYR